MEKDLSNNPLVLKIFDLACEAKDAATDACLVAKTYGQLAQDTKVRLDSVVHSVGEIKKYNKEDNEKLLANMPGIIRGVLSEVLLAERVATDQKIEDIRTGINKRRDAEKEEVQPIINAYQWIKKTENLLIKVPLIGAGLIFITDYITTFVGKK